MRSARLQRCDDENVLAASATLASPIAASAAAGATRTFRVGVLALDGRSDRPEGEAFVADLARQGFRLGANLSIERRLARRDGLAAAAAALVALKVDVIYAVDGTEAALAARRATSTVPVVFKSADPVGFGLVASLARPGGNLTGVSIQGPAITTKEIESMAQALGTLRSLAVVQPVGAAGFPHYRSYAGAATSAARALGIQIEFDDVADLSAYEPVIQELARRKVGAAAVMPATLSAAEFERIAPIFVRHRLPAIGPARFGFLLNCEFADAQIEERMAYFVGRILRGARPAELPVEEFSTLQLVVNARTARALGITLPRALLIQAAEVIE